MKTANYLQHDHGLHNEMPNFGESDFSAFKMVLISDLWANQEEVQPEVIDVKRRGKNLTIPYVVNLKGKLILIDGHHTTIAKKLNGQKKIKAMFLQL